MPGVDLVGRHLAGRYACLAGALQHHGGQLGLAGRQLVRDSGQLAAFVVRCPREMPSLPGASSEGIRTGRNGMHNSAPPQPAPNPRHRKDELMTRSFLRRVWARGTAGGAP